MMGIKSGKTNIVSFVKEFPTSHRLLCENKHCLHTPVEYGRKSSLPRTSQVRFDWWTDWKYSLSVAYCTVTPNSLLFWLMYVIRGSMFLNCTDEL